MRIDVILGFVLTIGATALDAQSRSMLPALPAAPAFTPITADQPLSLVGCAAVEDPAGQQFTMAEQRRRIKYRVKGTNLVRPGDDQRVRIVGGLLPTTNIAAQTGYLDPTVGATAMTGPIPTITSSTGIMELHVTRAFPVTGACPQP